MNANVLRVAPEPVPWRLTIPEAALRRLRSRLGRDAAAGEALDASLAYGVPGDVVARLTAHWLHDFDLEQQPVWGLPMFKTELEGASWSFVHGRSADRGALPLLLLHGYSGSVAEMAGVVEPLVNPGAHGASATDSFHVVCPALPAFGLSDGVLDVHAMAESCAALMQRLGYPRYLVHGSDLGANLALALAELDDSHVAGLHVTALPAYPPEIPEEMAHLTGVEKSQLALLSQVRDELAFGLPESPIEALAFALARLEEPAAVPTEAVLRDALLASLTLSWALGDGSARNTFYRTTRLSAAGVSGRPVAVSSFPLDAPSLRRFAELRHRVVEWTEHEQGGPMPALEQPKLLVGALRDFFRRFR
jgi:pimeloyl-ACP methyl ester carboxylesterase